MGMREKLIELLENDNCPLLYVLGENVGSLADYLIANGMTIPVQCKYCKSREWFEPTGSYYCDLTGVCVKDEHFCAMGERKDNG